jgi:hypothetical protein
MDMFRDDLAKLNGKVFDEFIYKKFQNNTWQNKIIAI